MKNIRQQLSDRRSLDERFKELDAHIEDPSFRTTSGMANEVNYWVFDYEPERELDVREHIEQLKRRNSREDFSLVVFDLYDLIIDYLDAKHFTDKTILKEKSSEKKNTELGKLLCLKQFLKDFTIIEERGVVEVSLWNEYLVFASLFGIADKVKDDFKRVCPEYFQMSSVANNLDTHTLLLSNTIHSLASTTSRAVRSSVVSTYTSSSSSIWSSSSSGFGGRSSFSGGGGFSGGGRGGGVR